MYQKDIKYQLKGYFMKELIKLNKISYKGPVAEFDYKSGKAISKNFIRSSVFFFTKID